MKLLGTYFIWFVLYSIIGWVWEVIICSVPAKRFINRGFLNGPYCPIYGSGALLVIALLGGIESPVKLFLTGAVLTCTLEYITSWAMEKLFHARWWDYSDKPLNINGRVCMSGFLAFGALSTILLLLIHPAVEAYTMRLSETAVSVAALVLFALVLSDVVYTVTRLTELNAKLKEFTEKWEQAQQIASMERKARFYGMPSGGLHEKLTASYTETLKRINAQESRQIRAFPKLRSMNYSEALERIRQYVNKTGEDETHLESEKSADSELQHGRGA